MLYGIFFFFLEKCRYKISITLGGLIRKFCEESYAFKKVNIYTEINNYNNVYRIRHALLCVST